MDVLFTSSTHQHRRSKQSAQFQFGQRTLLLPIWYLNKHLPFCSWYIKVFLQKNMMSQWSWPHDLWDIKCHHFIIFYSISHLCETLSQLVWILELVPKNSSIAESNWKFVPNLRKFLQGLLEILHSREWDVRTYVTMWTNMDGQPENIMPPATAVADMKA